MGGFITGIALTLFIIIPMQKTSYEKKIQNIGRAIFFLFFAIGFIVFYVARDPTDPLHPSPKKWNI